MQPSPQVSAGEIKAELLRRLVSWGVIPADSVPPDVTSKTGSVGYYAVNFDSN